MTVASLAPTLTFKSWLSTGVPNAFGTVTTYSAGTTTPVATYVDSTGTTQNTNPIVLNSRGEANVWLLPNVGYKFIEADQLGNIFKTTDQVYNSQLITYYGVDTGAANAYILTAATPYTSYQNGMLVFFVPGNTNTGPSTVNINGLGVIPIVTITGAPLGAGQLQAGIMAQIIYFNGAFQLTSIGSFTGSTVGTFGTEAPLASAATVDLGTVQAHSVQITGTTTITSFGSSASLQAPYYLIRFSGAMTLTYNATSLQLPGNTSIVTASGDSAIAQYLGSGNWRIAFYQYATSASSNSKIKPSDTQRISNTALTADPDLVTNTLGIGRYSWEIMLIFDSVSGAAGFKWTNSGSAVDSRAASPAVVFGAVNSAAYGPKQETPYGATITYATVATGANNNEVCYKGSLLISTAGTFGVSWAQNSSTASATTLRAGSYLTTTLLNTGTSANIVNHTYTTPGSGVETFPSGFNTLVIEVWSGGAGGGIANGGAGGGGGGGGAYSRTSMSVTGLGGLTLNYLVGSGGAVAFPGTTSSVTSGTQAITSMICTGGTQGASASGPGSPGAGGAGGAASGGTAVNTAGNSGAAGQTGSQPTGGAGGAGISGIYSGGGYGGRGGAMLPAVAGSGGIVVFNYS